MLVGAAGLSGVLASTARARSASGGTRVIVAIAPRGTTPAELARIPGAALGLMSAGIGRVPAAQTYLDASQGNRLVSTLYASRLPRIELDRAGGRLAVRPGAWDRVRSRARSAPADLVPGLLGSTLRGAGVGARAAPSARAAALLGIDERGRIAASSHRCAEVAAEHRIGGERQRGRAACRGVTVIRASIAGLRQLAAKLRSSDLLIAVSAPPPAPDHMLPVGIAGRGFRGHLTSESTHTSGLVLATDLAPTILARLGVAVPSEMTGQEVSAGGSADPADLERLDARLAAVPERRPQTLGVSVAAWAGLAGVAGLAFGRRGLRRSLPLLACTVFYLPAVLLVTAAAEPSATVETLALAAGAPALAAITVGLAGSWGALAIAAAASVGGYAVDVVAGGTLTSLSLIGPNPAGGTRLYGIGNELEAAAAVLVPLGVGAALTAWGRWTSPPTAAAAFALGALIVIAAFAPGQFGADVGAAVNLAVGAAVAALVGLGARRGRAAVLVLAAPIAALAALAVVDLVSGGDAHLTRSVLQAGGLQDLGDVAERRLRLSADNFGRYSGSPVLWAAVGLIVVGLVGRRTIARWFRFRPYARAGFLGATAATAAAVLVNDSGGLVLMIGTIVLALAAAAAWATAPEVGLRLR